MLSLLSLSTRTSLCLAAVLVVLLSIGCGRAKQQETAATEEPKAVEYFHANPATAGSLSGKITFRGPTPAKKVISMESQAECEQAHKGHPVYDQSVVVGKGAGLANVFVYIQSGLEGKKFEPAKETVVLDQHGCMFVPRVIGIQAGQTLGVKNSDVISHNIHPLPQSNREWNQHQAPESPNLEHRFPRPEVMIPVKCNVHSWMRAYIGVMGHPYFAVTGPDGSFEMKNVPPGDYVLAAWHEQLGEQKQQVHLGAAEKPAVDFTYK